MKRSGPLKRKKRLRPSAEPKLARSRIASRSSRRKTVAVQRSEIRGTRRRCEVCPVLAEAGFVTRCRGRVEGLHERRKAGAGGSLLNEANLMGSCNWGNGFIEDEAGPVRERTGTRLVVREGDPEWSELSVRWDRFR